MWIKAATCMCSRIRFKHTWIKPEGYDSGIKIYNCVAKEKVPLIFKNNKFITWYSCGPTVYDSSHIGHASNYVKIDIIQRILKHYFNYDVIHVMNITDIDDKIIARSKTLKISPFDLARKYEDEFWTDMTALHISKPHLILRVTENMNHIQDFIKQLLDNSFAYKAAGSVYFDVNRLKRYGKLENISLTVQTQHPVKKTPHDFALWKAPADGDPYWDSDWGPGRPGWHVECSALAGMVFGSTVDVHSGGIDLRFPHHENEEAQSCAYFCKDQWVNYWLHTGYLHLRDSEKMSKSLKNTVNISELTKMCSGDVFRFACVMSHYRSNLEFSKDLLVTAENVLNKYKFFVNDCRAYLKRHLKGDVNVDVLSSLFNVTVCEVRVALKDDFDTPSVIKSLNKLVSGTHKMLHASTSSQNASNTYLPVLTIVDFILNTFNVFGINLNAEESILEESESVEVMNILNDFRHKVRQVAIQNKDEILLKHCDDVRNSIKNYGITINDYKNESTWSK